jgi:hypothetical protein
MHGFDGAKGTAMLISNKEYQRIYANQNAKVKAKLDRLSHRKIEESKKLLTEYLEKVDDISLMLSVAFSVERTR